MAALLVGRNACGVSGCTRTPPANCVQRAASGPGMVAMLLAGYLAPAVVDWAQVRCWSSATAWGLLWLLVILLLLLSAPKPVLELIGSRR